MKVTLVLLALLLLVGATAAAEPIEWPTAEGGNGHYYEYVFSTLDWTAANFATNGMFHLGLPGHLATVRSQGEHDFLCNNMPTDCSPGCHFWIGGWRTDLSTPPLENWHWTTGEPWDWTPPQWGVTGQPTGGDEWALELAQTHGCHWNDHYTWDGWEYHGTGFIVEYEADAVPAGAASWSTVKALY